MIVSLRPDQPGPLPSSPASAPPAAAMTPFGLSFAASAPNLQAPPQQEGIEPPAPSATPAATPTPLNTSSPEILEQAMQALNEQLAKDGVNTSQFTLTPREDLVWSPFGNYYSRQIELRTRDGNWELISADLTLKNPEISVCDVRRVLGETHY